MKKYSLNVLMVLFAVGLLVAAHYRFIDSYIQIVAMTIGINIMMSTSLNLVNGNMGEFTCGHAGFMCVGAYISSILSVACFGSKFGDPLLPASSVLFVFPIILLIGGAVAAVSSLLVSIPSFKTRDDYLAIISIAVNYMIISALENMDFIGGSRGFQGLGDPFHRTYGLDYPAFHQLHLRQGRERHLPGRGGCRDHERQHQQD
ncbi:MAG: branched-chain amino acid ABC transporter permease [Desulfofustis sp.]